MRLGRGIIPTSCRPPPIVRGDRRVSAWVMGGCAAGSRESRCHVDRGLGHPSMAQSIVKEHEAVHVRRSLKLCTFGETGGNSKPTAETTSQQWPRTKQNRNRNHLVVLPPWPPRWPHTSDDYTTRMVNDLWSTSSIKMLWFIIVIVQIN